MSRTIDQQQLIGESPSFMSVMEHVSLVAPLNRPVLVIGERGTGKELIASRIHFLSQRWENAFIKLNCAAITETLLESELFGHEAGSFTGASKQRKGRFEQADEGTLLLDELSNTSTAVQEKILRVIEYGEFERVGGSKTITTNIRLIGSTNEDLPALAERGKFRKDLLDRLAFDVITLPPLRERREDILPLAQHFAQRMAAELRLEVFPGFDSAAEQVLLDYGWPGNVRELKNVVERAVYQHGDAAEEIAEVQFDPFASPWRPSHSESGEPQRDRSELLHAVTPGPVDLKQSVKDHEIRLIKQALSTTRFNQRKAAEQLGLTYHQLRGYLRKYDLLSDSDDPGQDQTA